MELETRAATLESEVSAREAEAAGAARRLRDLHEECAALRTASHHHHAAALRLQADLADAQVRITHTSTRTQTHPYAHTLTHTRKSCYERTLHLSRECRFSKKKT